MHVDYYNRKSPAKPCSEDAFAIHHERRTYAVFDGVTPLQSLPNFSAAHKASDPNDEQAENGAVIASRTFKQHFERPNLGSNLIEEFVQANNELRKRMIEAGIDLRQKHLLWSTCAAAVNIGAQEIRFAQLGDCMIVAQFRDGRIKALTKNQVKGISERAYEKREADRANGIYVPEEHFFEENVNKQAYHRWLANTPYGYGVANGMPEMKDYIQTGTVPRSEVKGLLLMSDGLYDLDEDLEQVYQSVAAKGLQSYIDDLEKYEIEHSLYSDDKTGIWIQLPPC